MILLIGVSGVQWSTFSVWFCAKDSSGPKWALPDSCLHSVHMARMVVSAVLCAYRRVVAEPCCCCHIRVSHAGRYLEMWRIMEDLRTRHTESYTNLRARRSYWCICVFIPTQKHQGLEYLPPEIIAIQNPDTYRNLCNCHSTKERNNRDDKQLPSTDWHIPIPLL